MTVKTLKTLFKHSFFRFALVGASNTLIGLGVIYFAWRVLGLGDLAANAIGYVIGFCWSYALNRLWTFNDSGSVGRSFVRFALVCAGAYAVNMLILLEARHLMGETSFLPHIFGMVAYTVLGYLGSRYFAFSKPPATAFKVQDLPN
jgi:putative flippase GtrA